MRKSDKAMLGERALVKIALLIRVVGGHGGSKLIVDVMYEVFVVEN